MKAHIKKITKISAQDKDLTSMFNVMMGVEHGDITIVENKFRNIYKNTDKIVKLFKKLINLTVLNACTQLANFSDVETFMKKSMQTLGELWYGVDNVEIESVENFLKFTKNIQASNIYDKYYKLWESNLIKKIIIMMCNIKNALNLENNQSDQADFVDKNILSGNFIVNSDGNIL